MEAKTITELSPGNPGKLNGSINEVKSVCILIKESSWKIIRQATREDKRQAVQNIINRIRKSYWL